jgi:hypothetical protein
MSNHGWIEKADYAIFADTGAEKTATMEYYNWIIEKYSEYFPTDMYQKWEIPIIRINDRNIYKDLMSQSNSSGNRFASIPAFTNNGRGMLRRQCTSEYKISQVDKAVKQIYGLTKNQRYPKTEIWYGITQDEMHRMSIPTQKWKTNVYPLIGYKIYSNGKSERFSDTFYRRSDIIEMYKEIDWPLPVKSSCVFCPYQDDKGWLFLKNVYPKDFSQAVEVDKKIRDSSKRGVKEPIFLHRSCIPVSEIDFENLQGDLFDDECSGNCMI